MSYCRKIYATHLRTRGVEQETIDFLQGRVPDQFLQDIILDQISKMTRGSFLLSMSFTIR